MKKLLLLVTLIGIAAVVGAVVVGMSTFDGTVVDNPYEKGLAWDREQTERASSGWSVGIMPPSPSAGRNRLYLTVTDRSGKPLSGKVTLSVSRPSSKSYDREYGTASTEKPGVYTASVEFPLYGYWDLDVRVTVQERTITFRKSIFALQGT
ncbi:MAG: hypothetical protein FIA94_03585 [Nitrospirae bacterium]|nr:hypothetical protein [Nitrospirota bacterium]